MPPTHPTTPVRVNLPASAPSTYAASSILNVSEATFSDEPLPEVTMKNVLGKDFPTFRAASVYSNPCAKTTLNPREAKSRIASSKSAGEVVCTMATSAPRFFLMSCSPSKAEAFQPASLTGPGVSNATLKLSRFTDALLPSHPVAICAKLESMTSKQKEPSRLLKPIDSDRPTSIGDTIAAIPFSLTIRTYSCI